MYSIEDTVVNGLIKWMNMILRVDEIDELHLKPWRWNLKWTSNVWGRTIKSALNYCKQQGLETPFLCVCMSNLVFC